MLERMGQGSWRLVEEGMPARRAEKGDASDLRTKGAGG